MPKSLSAINEDLNELMAKLNMNSAGSCDDDAIGAAENDDSDSTEQRLEEDARRMAADDRCYDGLWLAGGHMGMMVGLSSEDFERDQLEEYLEEVSDGDISGTMDDHFIRIEGVPLEQIAAKLRKRNLCIASGVLRRMAEGDFPVRIRITRLSDEGTSMEEILKLKQQGNGAFASGKYQDAIESYKEALFLFPHDMFIAPIDEMKEVVTILSNEAECELRLERPDDVCQTATDALLFDGDHEKTRIRRAKAELAFFLQGKSLAHLVQARFDLQNVIDCHTTSTGIDKARKLKKEADSLLEKEMIKYREENPTGDFDIKVRFLNSTCW